MGSDILPGNKDELDVSGPRFVGQHRHFRILQENGGFSAWPEVAGDGAGAQENGAGEVPNGWESSAGKGGVIIGSSVAEVQRVIDQLLPIRDDHVPHFVLEQREAVFGLPVLGSV